MSVDLRTDAGRELVTAMIEVAGNLITNFPARGWLSYDRLRERRSDLIMVALTGNRDGTSEVDYTVNPATGFPLASGPRNLAEPANSLMPTWDAVMGGLTATGLLAADRYRARTGEGQLVGLALSDVAFAMVGHLGRVAEAQLGGQDQTKDGNYLYGAFGHDFATGDGRRVMIVALTSRQWTALRKVTGLGDAFDQIGAATGLDLDSESGRYAGRDMIAAILRPVVRGPRPRHPAGAVHRHRRLVGAVPDVQPAGRVDPRCSAANPMWSVTEHPGVGSYLMPGTPLDFSGIPRQPVRRAPLLGEHTEEVLSELLGLTQSEVGNLESDGTVALSSSRVP